MSDTPIYVINPHTGRPIKAGSKLYNQLVREGMIAGEPVRKSKNIVARTESTSQAYRVKAHLEQNQPPPEGKRYSVCRDKKSICIKNKKAKSMSSEQMATACADALTKVMNNLAKTDRRLQP